MTNDYDKDYAKRVFRKLNSFLQVDIPVHFKLLDGKFRNGIILDLDLNKCTLVLKEDMLGNLPILLEEIDIESICERRKKDG